MNKNEQILIYNFNEHGIYYKPDYAYSYKTVIFTIGTVQLGFNYNTEELLTVTGYIPLINADKKTIKILPYEDDKFIVSMKNLPYERGMAYDYFDFFPVSKEYFMIDKYNPKLVYDKNNKIIQIGSFDNNDKQIKVNKNIICGLDQDESLKSILVLIDVIIKGNNIVRTGIANKNIDRVISVIRVVLIVVMNIYVVCKILKSGQNYQGRFLYTFSILE